MNLRRRLQRLEQIIGTHSEVERSLPLLTRHQMAVFVSRRFKQFLGSKRYEDMLPGKVIDPPLTAVELKIPLFEQAYRWLMCPGSDSTPEQCKYNRAFLRVMLSLAREIEAGGELPQVLASLRAKGIDV